MALIDALLKLVEISVLVGIGYYLGNWLIRGRCNEGRFHSWERVEDYHDNPKYPKRVDQCKKCNERRWMIKHKSQDPLRGVAEMERDYGGSDGD